jgi:FdhD protein
MKKDPGMVPPAGCHSGHQGNPSMNDDCGMSVLVDATTWSAGAATQKQAPIATEVPFTIMAGDLELATLLVTPQDLKVLTIGYLYSSGFIADAGEVRSIAIDRERWVAWTELAREPDPAIMRKRVYSASCGRCAIYSSLVETGMRSPCPAALRMTPAQIGEAAAWIESASTTFTKTGGVHAAGFFDPVSDDRFVFEDVARHNAVDKAIGHGLLEGCALSRWALVRTGRTSSEILFKTRRCGSPITVARGAPTHQAVLLARELGITLVGFARGNEFTVYAHCERISG